MVELDVDAVEGAVLLDVVVCVVDWVEELDEDSLDDAVVLVVNVDEVDESELEVD